MKPCKVAEKNREDIVAVIDEVEGNSSINLMSYTKVTEIAQYAEKKLEKLEVPIKERVGAEFYFCPQGPSAMSYKYGQGATDVRMIRKSTGWFVVEINRTKVYPKKKASNTLIVTAKQKEIAISKFCQKFVVAPNPASGLPS